MTTDTASTASADGRASIGARVTAYGLIAASGAITAVNVLAEELPGSSRVPARLVPAVLLLLALAVAARRHRLGLPRAVDPRVVLGLCGLVLVAATVGPVQSSKDLWAYASYGRMVGVHHVSPYESVPSDFPDDPFVEQMNPIWHDSPSVYGPAFSGFSALIALGAGDSLAATRLLYKSFTAAAVFAGAVLLHRRRVDPTAIAAAVLHPAVMAFGVAGGHNDAFVGLAVLGASLLAASRRPGAAGAVIALGCAVKVTALLPALAIAAWLWRRPDDGRRAVVRFSTVGVALLGLAYLVAGGMQAIEPLRAVSNNTSWASFWRPLREELTGTLSPDASGKLALLLVASLVVLCAVRHSTDLAPHVGAATVLLVYYAGSGYTLVWYAMWIAPVAALCFAHRTNLLHLLLATAFLIPVSNRGLLHRTEVVVLLVIAAFTVRELVVGRREPSGEVGAATGASWPSLHRR